MADVRFAAGIHSVAGRNPTDERDAGVILTKVVGIYEQFHPIRSDSSLDRNAPCPQLVGRATHERDQRPVAMQRNAPR